MKTTIFLWSLLICFSANAFQSDCDNAHSSASYAIFHTNKSLKADNFDHQRYYAERAIEALEKTQGFVENCGCEQAKINIDLGLESLKKGADPDDWDKGRYYTKKAYAEVQNLIGAIEVCNTGKVSDSYTDTAYLQGTNNTDETLAEEQKILEQQQKLEAEKRRLEEEQKRLDAELEAQRKLKEKMEIERQREMQQQIKLKVKAEQALQNFEKSITELSEILGCAEAYNIVYDNYLRAENALESESLTGTRRYYTEKAQAISRKALEALERCQRSSK
ncbi:hypothetical protein ACJD0Z_12930 [Flavobacteriaceae bacterium M23B6Z8]